MAMLDLIYMVLCAVSGIVALWTMQCLTVRAGLACNKSRSMMALRISLAALALSLFFDAYNVSKDAAYASIGGTILVSALLIFQFVLPFAIGGRKGADLISVA